MWSLMILLLTYIWLKVRKVIGLNFYSEYAFLTWFRMILSIWRSFLWKRQNSLIKILFKLIIFFVISDFVSNFRIFVLGEENCCTKFLLLSLLSNVVLALIVVLKAVFRSERSCWTQSYTELFIHNVVFNHVIIWRCFLQQIQTSWSEHAGGLVNSLLMWSVLVFSTQSIVSLKWAE
jgi:hypothetical protein